MPEFVLSSRFFFHLHGCGATPEPLSSSYSEELTSLTFWPRRNFAWLADRRLTPCADTSTKSRTNSTSGAHTCQTPSTLTFCTFWLFKRWAFEGTIGIMQLVIRFHPTKMNRMRNADVKMTKKYPWEVDYIYMRCSVSIVRHSSKVPLCV